MIDPREYGVRRSRESPIEVAKAAQRDRAIDPRQYGANGEMSLYPLKYCEIDPPFLGAPSRCSRRMRRQKESKTMAIEIKESGPAEDEVEAMLGRGRVKVEEVRIEQGKFGEQIRLSLRHHKGGEFRAWVTPSRSRIEEVCRCFGIPTPSRGQAFDEMALVGMVGEVRISSKVDANGITRAKVDAWLERKIETAPAKKAAPARDADESGEGIPF